MRIWRFKAGEAVPQWLEKTENCTATFAVDANVFWMRTHFIIARAEMGDGVLINIVGIDDSAPAFVMGQGGGVLCVANYLPYDPRERGARKYEMRALQ